MFITFVSHVFSVDMLTEIKISFVTCSVDHADQGRLTTILAISISESTVHVTELILISLNLSTLKTWETKNSSF